MKFELTIPATLSNFGPGFDTLGMAIDRYLKVKFEHAPELKESQFHSSGEYPAPGAAENLVFNEIKKFSKMKFKMTMTNDIPLKRGLGSSSAANAAVAAIKKILEFADSRDLAEIDNASLTQLIRPKIYNEAVELEGHPDNITPCLFGGFTAARADKKEAAFLNIPFPSALKLHVLIPEIEVETKMARMILPESYKLKDVVVNLQNLAFMVAEFCLNSRSLESLPIFSNLKSLLCEKLHQDYRLKLCGPCAEAITILNSYEKICGAFLSGSGATVCAIAPEEATQEIKNAAHSFAAQNVAVRHYVHNIEYNGLIIKRGDL